MGDVFSTADYRALLAGVRAAPEADLPRLVLADFFDDRGQPDRAEFVRGQIALHRLPGDPARDGERHAVRLGLLARIDTPLVNGWLADGSDWHWSGDEIIARFHIRTRLDGQVYEVERGFVRAVECRADWWLANGDDLLAREPVRRVELTTWPGRVWIGRGDSDPAAVIRLDGDPLRLELVVGDVDAESPTAALLAARWPGVEFTLPAAGR